MGSGADQAVAGSCETTVAVAVGGSEVASVVSFGVGKEALVTLGEVVVALVKAGVAGSSSGALGGPSVHDGVLGIVSVAVGDLTGADEEPEEPPSPVAMKTTRPIVAISASSVLTRAGALASNSLMKDRTFVGLSKGTPITGLWGASKLKVTVHIRPPAQETGLISRTFIAQPCQARGAASRLAATVRR